MKSLAISSALALVLAACCGAPARAVIVPNTDVTANWINGTGAANGGFTVDRANGVELGLRGKLRFDSNNDPADVYNYVGQSGDNHGIYAFNAVGVNTGVGSPPGWADATTPIWNFDWSINSNYDGSAPGRQLGVLTYELHIDFNPLPGSVTPEVAFDPINLTFADHSFGDNTTANGAGVEAGNPTAYGILTLTKNLAQNSWSMEFFDAPFPGGPTFDPTAVGTYTIRLVASDMSGPLASTSIDVMTVAAVPEASAFLFGGAICGVIGLWSLRQRRKVEAGLA